MWKLVTRSIRETLERRVCRTNVYSQTLQDTNTKDEVKPNLTCNHKFLAPAFSVCNKEFCGSTKTGGTKDKNYESKWNTKYTLSDAIGWSSVLAIGWVVCQTLCLRRRFFEKEKKGNIKNKIPPVTEVQISHLFDQVLNLGPKNILPIANCVGHNKIYAQENNEAEWKAERPFGPITVEEALKEATDEFANTHKKTVAEFELRYGLKALEEKRYKDAIKHFTTGANLSSTSSMFNLGLCYELGLGTLVDHVKAAKYYNEAAERGHADAIYNLGVFHAQGRGGFTVDIHRARSYFMKAAKLGQSQAQHALDLEKKHYQFKQKNIDITIASERNGIFKYIKNHENMNHILRELNNYNNIQSQVEFLEKVDNTPRSIKYINPTQLVFNVFGLSKKNVLPLSTESKNYSVPC